MKIILDVPTEFSVSLEDLIEFLTNCGWEKIEKHYENSVPWQHKGIIIVLPISEDLLDSAYMVAEAIRTISKVYFVSFGVIIKRIELKEYYPDYIGAKLPDWKKCSSEEAWVNAETKYTQGWFNINIDNIVPPICTKTTEKPIFVTCENCAVRFDETTIKVVDIQEGDQGQDIVVFICPLCQDETKSVRK